MIWLETRKVTNAPDFMRNDIAVGVGRAICQVADGRSLVKHLARPKRSDCLQEARDIGLARNGDVVLIATLARLWVARELTVYAQAQQK